MNRKRIEDRRNDIVEKTVPAHEEAERHADCRREQEAEPIAAEAGKNMLRKRSPGKGMIDEEEHPLRNGSRRGKKSRRHEAEARQAGP